MTIDAETGENKATRIKRLLATGLPAARRAALTGGAK